jgi:hypothetical protein
VERVEEVTIVFRVIFVLEEVVAVGINFFRAIFVEVVG